MTGVMPHHFSLPSSIVQTLPRCTGDRAPRGAFNSGAGSGWTAWGPFGLIGGADLRRAAQAVFGA